MIQNITQIEVDKRLPLWEDHWPRERIIERRKEVGETAFKRGFQNIAMSDEDLLFSHIDDAKAIGVTWENLIHDHFPRFMGVDLSGDKRPGNAIFVYGLVPGTGNKVVIDVICGAWKSPETASKIYDAYEKYRPAIIKVENNAYQSSLQEWMAATPKYKALPIQAHTTGVGKSHPEYGLPGLAVELENRVWKIPMETEHPLDCTCGICHFLREARAYPQGTSTDAVMAWWFANEAGKKALPTGNNFMRTGNKTPAAEAVRGGFD